jgi:hypothetical protein
VRTHHQLSTAVSLVLLFTGASCDQKNAPATAPPPTSVAPPAPLPPVAAEPPSNCPGGVEPTEPVGYGTCQVELAKTRAQSTARVTVVVLASDPSAAAALEAAGAKLDSRPESYAIVARGDETLVVGSDATGAMYGALDVAERLHMDGAAALPVKSPVTASPTVTFRAANPFLLIPQSGETSWWFLDPSFWTEFLDMMARGRLNFLDMHAMGVFSTTKFPNALLWFATSASFPDLGVPKPEREADLAMLNRLVKMAHERGIRVGIMSYRADLSPRAEKDESEADDPEIETYTREAVRDLVTRAPGLAYFGFRVGESHRKSSWYTDTFIAGMREAHTGTSVYTRSWLTDKQSLLGIASAAGPETIIEVKYNGEHLGPPYIIAGSHMLEWKASYSYEDYLEPPDPYRFVFQIRAGGTHRIFRYASYERSARAVKALGFSPRVYGFSFEAAHAYTPQRDYYHKNHDDSFSPWTFRRDELSYILFGRLGYDPTTPDKVFRAMLADRVGTDRLWDAVQAASDIVPWIQTAETCGADQRNYAPELELGGSVAFWASPSHPPPHSPHASTPGCKHGHFSFDGFAVAMPYEAAEDLVAGRGTSRLSPVDIAQQVLADARNARSALEVRVDPANAEARDYVRECVALADLGEWFGHKLRAATALAVYERSGSAEWVEAAKREVALADAAFTKLADDTAYIAPFDEPMRMRELMSGKFHWKEEVPLLASDPASIEKSVEEVRAQPPKPSASLPHPEAWLDAARGAGPGLSQLDISPMDPRAPSWTVAVTLASAPPQGAHVNVLYRTFKSNGADWATVAATGAGTAWKATVPGTSGEGGMFAVEITGGQGHAFRYPDVRKETPYRVVAP